MITGNSKNIEEIQGNGKCACHAGGREFESRPDRLNRSDFSERFFLK